MIEMDIRKLLQEIAIQTRKRYSRELRKLGLHIGQELALYYLWEQEGLTQSQLKDLTGSEAPTISNMVRKLEEDNIVYRKHDEHDSRISKVYLTEKGWELKVPVEKMWHEHEKCIFSGISPEERMLLRRLLQDMNDNLHE